MALAPTRGARTNPNASIGNEYAVERISASENGIADTKEDIARPCATGKLDGCIEGGSNCCPDLDDELGIDATAGIESQCAGQSGGGGVVVYAGTKRAATAQRRTGEDS